MAFNASHEQVRNLLATIYRSPAAADQRIAHAGMDVKRCFVMMAGIERYTPAQYIFKPFVLCECIEKPQRTFFKRASANIVCVNS